MKLVKVNTYIIFVEGRQIETQRKSVQSKYILSKVETCHCFE